MLFNCEFTKQFFEISGFPQMGLGLGCPKKLPGGIANMAAE